MRFNWVTRGARREAAATARLAGPVIGGQLALVGMSFVDTVMAGNLDARALAAVAVGSNVWAPLMLFCIGVLMALPPAVAQYEGAGRRQKIAPLARQAFWVSQGLALVAVILLHQVRPLLDLLHVQPEIVPTVEGYLEALTWGIPAWAAYMVLRFLSEGMGETRPTLYFGLLGLLVNVAANWALIYGHFGLPALGAVGCGFATALVWWAQLLGMALFVVTRPRYRGLGLFGSLERPRREAIGEILRIGVPVGVSIFIEGSLFGVVALLMGSLGTQVVAGHQVALNFAALTFMVPLGLSMAVTVRVGNAVGRDDWEAVRRAGFVGIGMAMVCQVISATVMLTLPEVVAGIYTNDPRVVAIAVDLLFLAALFQLSDGLQVSSAGALRGLKDTRVPMVITLVAYWLVGLPLGYFLGFRFELGAEGLWIGLIAGLTVAAVLLSSRFVRSSRGPYNR